MSILADCLRQFSNPKYNKLTEADYKNPMTFYIASVQIVSALHRLKTGKDPSKIVFKKGAPLVESFAVAMFGEDYLEVNAQKKLEVLQKILILHIHHGTPHSTFEGLSAQSAGAGFNQSLGSAVEALGRPLHGGANFEVIKQFWAIHKYRGSTLAEKAESYAKENKILMGFGHPVYAVTDPRATEMNAMLMEMQNQNCGRNYAPLKETAFALQNYVLDVRNMQPGVKKKLYPNVDFFSGIVYEWLKVNPEFNTLMFWAGRCPSIIAYLQMHHKLRIMRCKALVLNPKGYQSTIKKKISQAYKKRSKELSSEPKEASGGQGKSRSRSGTQGPGHVMTSKL